MSDEWDITGLFAEGAFGWGLEPEHIPDNPTPEFWAYRLRRMVNWNLPEWNGIGAPPDER